MKTTETLKKPVVKTDVYAPRNGHANGHTGPTTDRGTLLAFYYFMSMLILALAYFVAMPFLL